MKKNLMATVLMLALILFTMVGCQQKEEIKSEGRTVTVLTSGLGEPYSLLDEKQNWTGIEAEMWSEIEQRTGWTVKVKQVSFDGLFGELDVGRGDVAANCFAITPERSEKYYASVPFYGDAQCLAVAEGNLDINAIADLSGQKIGVTAGQASQIILSDMQEDYDFELVTYESLNTGYADLALGRLDAMGGPATGVNQYMNASGDQLRIVDQKLKANNVGYFYAKTDQGKELCHEVNQVIEEMLADGTCAEITKKWLFEDMTTFIN